MQADRIRSIIAALFGLFFACFGVFIFGDFQYRGLTLHEHVWPLFLKGSFDGFAEGLYVLLGSSIMVDWFTVFSPSAISDSSLGAILTDETVWPVFATWVIGGFIVGTIAKGLLRGIKIGLVSILLTILLWVIWGFFVNADITAIFVDNILNTLGKVFTITISGILGSLLGGWVSGPYESE